MNGRQRGQEMKTDPVSTRFSHLTLAVLEESKHLTVERTSRGLVLGFECVELALADIERAKVTTWNRYLKEGGNPRNKRGHSSVFAGITRAVVKAGGETK